MTQEIFAHTKPQNFQPQLSFYLIEGFSEPDLLAKPHLHNKSSLQCGWRLLILWEMDLWGENFTFFASLWNFMKLSQTWMIKTHKRDSKLIFQSVWRILIPLQLFWSEYHFHTHLMHFQCRMKLNLNTMAIKGVHFLNFSLEIHSHLHECEHFKPFVTTQTLLCTHLELN